MLSSLPLKRCAGEGAGCHGPQELGAPFPTASPACPGRGCAAGGHEGGLPGSPSLLPAALCPSVGRDALVLTELPWRCWQDRGWSRGCAVACAAAMGLLVGGSVCPHPTGARGRLRQSLRGPGAARGRGTSSWERAREAPVSTQPWEDRAFLGPGKHFPPLCRAWSVFPGGRGEPQGLTGPRSSARWERGRRHVGSSQPDALRLGAGWHLSPAKPLLSPCHFCA